MILYDNNINERKNILKIEKELIEFNINIQKNNKKIILNYMQNFADSVNNFDGSSANSILDLLKRLKNCSELCNENISYLGKCSNTIDNIEFSISYNSHDLSNILNTFNTEYSELNKIVSENTLQIQECLYAVSENASFFQIKNDNTLYKEDANVIAHEKNTNEFVTVSKDTVSESVVLSDEQNSEALASSKNNKVEQNSKNIELFENKKVEEKYDNFSIPKVENPQFIQEIEFTIPRKIDHIENTLVVSESTKSVTLPYSIYTLNQTLKEKPDKYSCIDDIILESYTLPLDMFKNPFSSRFKQAFKLIRKKEHGSVFDAFELGLELMFNYKLHPAIIAACKNLEELDIYLDYLSEDKTNEFKCFNVKFDLPPAVIK